MTGAARNTGLVIAEAFAAAGATLVLNDSDEPGVAEQAQRLRATHGGRVVEAPADVSEQEQVDALFGLIERECGRLDTLVNNAIVQGVGHCLVDTPRDLLEEVFRVNVFGAYACSQAAARLMIPQKSGSIVSIGSNTAQRAIRGRTAYIASKGAIDALIRAMAVELGPHGIRVNGVTAGYIHSDRWEALTAEATHRRRENIPLGREAGGRDIADAVLFLASEAAAQITGACLTVDGGVSAQLVPAEADV